MVAHAQGDIAAADAYYERSLEIRREVGDLAGMVFTLQSLGAVAWTKGDYARTAERNEEALALAQQIGDRPMSAVCSASLAEAVSRLGDSTRAFDLAREALLDQRDLGDELGIADSLEGIAVVIAQAGHRLEAARLAGASEAIRVRVGRLLTPTERRSFDRELAIARGDIRLEDWEAAVQSGRDMGLSMAVDLALSILGNE